MTVKVNKTDLERLLQLKPQDEEYYILKNRIERQLMKAERYDLITNYQDVFDRNIFKYETYRKYEKEIELLEKELSEKTQMLNYAVGGRND